MSLVYKTIIISDEMKELLNFTHERLQPKYTIFKELNILNLCLKLYF